MTERDSLRFRDAEPSEWDDVAALHIASWRSAYRGILRDAYLETAIEAERRAVWQSRFTGGARPDQIVVIGEDASGFVALACILAGQDPRWGSLIDNLHVRPDRKRAGIGRLVLAEAAARVPSAHRATPLHLTVLEGNAAARAAYESWGGKLVEQPDADLPDGQTLRVRRYAWDNPDALMRALGGQR